ncbi:MAG: hypothetical protein K2W95_01315 [Candidatus Obscuribacterales bacterium]|nr:hypothetical protein [Candidatus Obscuribacterales bacterium]
MTANNSRLLIALMLSTALTPWPLVQAAESESTSPASAQTKTVPVAKADATQTDADEESAKKKSKKTRGAKANETTDAKANSDAESKTEAKSKAPDVSLSDKPAATTTTTDGAATTTSAQAPAANGNAVAASAPAAPEASPPAAAPPEASAPAPATSSAPKLKTKWKPGDELTITTNTEDLVPTDDAELARKQVEAYPDSPEASFILAVALTRTSKVEDALKEVRRARKLAEAKGGTGYFDKMITTYEEMLKNFPEENRVRYGLAWAYYMKAYLLANYSKKVAAWKAANGDPNNPKPAAAANAAPATATDKPAATAAAKPAPALIPGVNLNKSGGVDLGQIVSNLSAAAQGGNVAGIKIPSIMDKTDPADVPQIKRYYELSIKKLDDLVARKPDDVWATVYRAHLKAEYTGSLDEAMKTWTQCKEKFPNNPASYFFLGEGYLKQGNLKESINNVSRAVALRAMGF